MATVYKTYKFRLYPSKEQEAVLEKTLDSCRFLYNCLLEQWKENYKAWVAGGKIHEKPDNGKSAQGKEFRKIKADFPQFEGIFAHLLEDVIIRFHDKAVESFYRRVKQKAKKAGFPRFKGKNRFDSFTYPDQRAKGELGEIDAPSKKSGWNYDPKTKKLTLYQLHGGQSVAIKMRKHRQSIGRVNALTIKREGKHWYACFVIGVEKEAVTVKPITNPVGIDLGLESLITLSTGEIVEHPRFLRKSEDKLKAAQRAVSRKKKGSNSRRRAVQHLAATHRKITNQRKDYLHKVSRRLVSSFDGIFFEDLQIANMTKRPKPVENEDGTGYAPNGAAAKAGLNKSILDASWGILTTFTRYKAAEAGILYTEVDPRDTSQICSVCSVKPDEKKTLDVRLHKCEHCGYQAHRDHNAAINILRKGLGTSLQGAATPQAKLLSAKPMLQHGVPVTPSYVPPQPKLREVQSVFTDDEVSRNSGGGKKTAKSASKPKLALPLEVQLSFGF
jgi:putative transposase